MLKQTLDRLYAEFNAPDTAADPIHLVRRYAAADDREAVGFIAASLAFGRVTSVLQSIARVEAIMGPSPAAYIREFDFRREAKRFAAVGHRWIRGRDLVALLWLMRQMIDRCGSIERFFVATRANPDADMRSMLESFSSRALALDVRSAGVRYFFPRPSAGSACKRLNLFLRWMVRRDRLDLGVWTDVAPSQLIIPLDTHVIRVGRCLRLTRYSTPGWRMAEDITACLRRFDASDPVKYDFALCHLGMMYPGSSALEARLGRFKITDRRSSPARAPARARTPPPSRRPSVRR